MYFNREKKGSHLNRTQVPQNSSTGVKGKEGLEEDEEGTGTEWEGEVG